jgi:CRISPR-associated protein Cmr4
MYLQEHTRLCVLHAISPIHAGSGAATGAVDLPIQRERHTGWPHVQASGVKGAFRDHCLRYWSHRDSYKNFAEKVQDVKEMVNRIFGAETRNGEDEKSKSGQAGAVAFSDARLLAFPVRSSAAPFVWIVCPALLKRLIRDFALVPGLDTPADTLPCRDDQFVSIIGDFPDEVILEDLCVTKTAAEVEGIKALFTNVAPEMERLILLSDSQFNFLVETATEIQAQIKINERTGITQDGSLRYEELLPMETVLYTLAFFGAERVEDDNPWQMATIRDGVIQAVHDHIQIGGDVTLGRGICKIAWLDGKK